MSIKRTNNKSIRYFAAHVQTDAEKFDGTDYEFKSKSLARRWRKIIGSNFQSINNMVNETVIIPDVWSKKLPLRQLVDTSESYLCARAVKDADDKNTYEKNKKEENLARFRKTRSRISKAIRNKHPPDGTPNVTQQQPDPEVENWKKHVKYHIFQHKFITAW